MYLTGFADESGKDINNQIKATKELGWSNIELRATGFEGDLASMSDADFDKLYAALDGSGVKINCFGSGIANWGKDIDAPFEDTLNEVKACLPRLKKLGCEFVRIMSYKINRDPETWVALPNDQQNFAERAKRLNEIVPMFLDAGVVPVHENCMNYGGMSWQNTLELVDAVKGLKLVFDTGNPPFTPDMGKGIYTKPIPRQDTWEFYQKVKEHIAYVHIKDAKGDCDIKNGEIFPTGQTFTFPGEGEGSVKEIVKDLLDNGYDGGFSMEPHMALVFHDDSVESKAQVQFDNYVEYGRRFMKIIEDAGYGSKL